MVCGGEKTADRRVDSERARPVRIAGAGNIEERPRVNIVALLSRAAGGQDRTGQVDRTHGRTRQGRTEQSCREV